MVRSALSRRAFVVGGLGVLASACSGGDPETAATARSGPTPSTDPPTPFTRRSTSTTRPTTTTAKARTGLPPIPAPADPGLGTDPFTLGVASGDPLPTAVILWTRLAPAPDSPGGGVPAVPVKLAVDVTSDGDADFAALLSSFAVELVPDAAHTAHVDAKGLSPNTWYRFRFRIGTWTSPAGRTRTAPSPDAVPESFRLLSASCQKWSGGLYTAYAHMLKDEPDLVAFCGDYIYEDAGEVDKGPRDHPLEEAKDLESYRRRYALYKTDKHLQAIHASCPWVMTWDDHEVNNNYAADIPSSGVVEGFAARRLAAYRAWWEHMPTRLAPPQGTTLPIYREIRWGKLASLCILDGRQYRSDQTCGDLQADLCAETADPNRTMLGAEQEAWLADRLTASAADGVTWTVLLNGTIMTDMTLRIGERAQANMDQWDGYPEARRRLLQAVRDSGVANLIALTGDFHASVVGNLTLDNTTLGSEFVAPAISSGFNPDRNSSLKAAPLVLPDLVFGDGTYRGFLRNTINAQRWQADYRWVESVSTPDAPLVKAPKYFVLAGEPGVKRG